MSPNLRDEWQHTFLVKPRAKQRPRVVRRNAYTPKETVQAEAELRWLMQKAFKRERFTGPVEVEVKYFFERPKSVSLRKRPMPCVKPDCSNLIKLIEDAGNKIIWDDDAQIIRLTAEKAYCTQERIEFMVRPVELPAMEPVRRGRSKNIVAL